MSAAALDALTRGGGHQSRRRPAGIWADRLFGSDPGLNRLLLALQGVVSIGLAMLVEYLFARTVRPLWIEAPPGVTLPAKQAALIGAQHHGLTIIAMMLGAIVGLMLTFAGPMFPSRRSLAAHLPFLPVPMIAGMSVGLALGPHRAWALVALVVVMVLGTYARRFGPAGVTGGMLAFLGTFFGYFLHTEFSLGDIGWLAVEIGIGVVVATICQFTLFFPSRKGALRRSVRSYSARERDVGRRSLELFDASGSRERRRLAKRLRRRLARLNEAALLIDARLAQPGSVPAHSDPAALHQALFDSELSLTNASRFGERLAAEPLPIAVRAIVREALAGVAVVDLFRASEAARALLDRLGDESEHGRHEADAPAGRRLDPKIVVVLHRYAISVLGFVEAAERWRLAALRAQSPSMPDHDAPFTSSVTLFGGWLPGSAMVSTAASLEARSRLASRVALPPYLRAAIQMAVAGTAAVLLAQLLSEKRFYWAVIAVFVTFMGANNSGEQLRKGVFRVIGTGIGVILGAVIAHVAGDNTAVVVAIILAAIFLGLYLFRINYAFMVIAITIMISQLYVQLDEFSDALLLLRLEETAIGAGVAIAVVVLVLPLRTGRVARVATRQYLQTLGDFVRAAVNRLAQPTADAELRDAARQIDSAYQTLTATFIPLRSPLELRPEALREQIVYAVSASRHYARSLVADARSDAGVPENLHGDLLAACDRLSASIDELVQSSEHGDAKQRTYTRSASLFEAVANQVCTPTLTSPTRLALLDLQLIDGALAGLAENVGMTVVALDTGGGDDDRADERDTDTEAPALAKVG